MFTSRLERVMKNAPSQDVLKIHLERKVPMRIAANMLGIGRVAEAVQAPRHLSIDGGDMKARRCDSARMLPGGALWLAQRAALAR
jgi:hypothetical protein